MSDDMKLDPAAIEIAQRSSLAIRQKFEEIRRELRTRPGEMYDRPALPGGSADGPVTREAYIAWCLYEMQKRGYDPIAQITDLERQLAESKGQC